MGRTVLQTNFRIECHMCLAFFSTRFLGYATRIPYAPVFWRFFSKIDSADFMGTLLGTIDSRVIYVLGLLPKQVSTVSRRYPDMLLSFGGPSENLGARQTMRRNAL